MTENGVEMANSKVRSIRFPTDLIRDVESASREVGMSFSAYVVETLRERLSHTSAEAEWLEALRLWLLATYSETDFPPDVTRQVFLHVRDSREFRAGYDALVQDDHGRVDPARRARLHKNVGRMIKQALGAEVIGRVVDLDPNEYLIRSHALLRPTATSEGHSANKGERA